LQCKACALCPLMQPVPRQGAQRRARRAPHLPQQDVRRRRLAAVARLCARLGLRRRPGAAAQRRSAAAPAAACRTNCRRTSTPLSLQPCRGERAPRAPAAGLRIGAGAAGRRNAGAGSPAGAGGWSGAVCGCGSRASLAVAALQAARALGPHQRPRERHVLAPAPSAPWFGRRQQPSLPSKRGLRCVLSSSLQDAMVSMSCACGYGLLYATAGCKTTSPVQSPQAVLRAKDGAGAYYPGSRAPSPVLLPDGLANCCKCGN